MSIIARLIGRLFPRTEFRALLVGLDAAGKTTVLYQLKLGKVVTTIPTIGFNVETLEYNIFSFTFWDVGGRDKIRPLWRHYFHGTDVLIFVADSNDRDRIEDAREELTKFMNEDELREASLLVFANKQDLPNALSAAEVAENLGLHNIRGREWFCQSACATTGEGLHEGLDWISKALTNKKAMSMKLPVTPVPVTPVKVLPAKESLEEMEAKRKAEMFAEWLEREDNPDDEFLEQLSNYSLNTWDHRTHLRISWLLLTKHGRQKGLPLIFQGIKNFLAKCGSPELTQNAEFHETKTYFWVHMVHYAIATTANPAGDFKGFLFMNPQLSDSELVFSYFTMDAILNNPDAWTQVVMPDKKSLPSLISNTGVLAAAAPVVPLEERLTPAQPMDDGKFLEHFTAGTLPSWSHDAKIRAIWCLLQEHGRRKGGTDKILQALETVEGAGYNLTINYFWIQMVTIASAKAEGVSAFAQFIQHPSSVVLLDPDLIKKHYSEGVIASGVATFAVPDKKPLPNVL